MEGTKQTIKKIPMASSSPTLIDDIFPGPQTILTTNNIIDDGKSITELPYFLNPFSITNTLSNVAELPTSLQHQQYRAIGDGDTDHHASGHIVTHSLDVDDRKKYKLFAASGIFIASFIFVVTIMMSARTAFPAEQSLLRTIMFKQVQHPEPPTKYWGTVTKPYPTGAFWTNLVVRTGDGAIGLYPYGVKTTDMGVQVSHTPFQYSTSHLLVN